MLAGLFTDAPRFRMYLRLAWTGDPIQLETVLCGAQHSLIDLPGAREEIRKSAAIVARGPSIEHYSLKPALP
jgi:hypothetical protein